MYPEQQEPEERRVELRPVRIRAFHKPKYENVDNWCFGELTFSGVSFTRGDGRKFIDHKCSGCGETVSLTKQYPYITYEEIYTHD